MNGEYEATRWLNKTPWRQEVRSMGRRTAGCGGLSTSLPGGQAFLSKMESENQPDDEKNSPLRKLAGYPDGCSVLGNPEQRDNAHDDVESQRIRFDKGKVTRRDRVKVTHPGYSFRVLS